MSERRVLPIVAPRVPDHEDASLHSFLGAAPAEQAKMLDALGLPAAVALILVNACENRCFFCANRGTIAVAPSEITPWERARAHLAARPSDVTRLLIGGNEPCVHPDFDRAMDAAHVAGFTHVELMTSGLRLGDADRLAHWVARGLRTVAVPIYASSAALHDAVCGTASFDRLVHGLDAAHTAGVTIHLHTLLLRRTASDLPALARLARSRWNATLAVAPLRDKKELFDYTTEALPLDEAAAILRPIGDEVGRLGLAICAARERTRAPSLVMEMYFRTQRRRFAPPCEGCLDRPACPGVVDGQLDTFGTRGLMPRHD